MRKTRRKRPPKKVVPEGPSFAHVLLERAKWPADHPNHPASWEEAFERAKRHLSA